VTAGYSAGAISGPDASDQFTYTFSNLDHFVYDRDGNSLVNTFNNDIQHTLTDFIEPVDGITLSTATDDTVINGAGGPIRYGRLHVLNAFGPETETLLQTFRAEYFDGSRFVVNTLDSDTAYDVVNIGPISVSNVGDGANPLLNTDSTASGSGLLLNGTATISWSPTLGGRYGSYQFTYTTDDWLQFDWDDDGSDDNPSAEVTFGQYRGNDRVIYWKEINY